jgi:hypothetical protein
MSMEYTARFHIKDNYEVSLHIDDNDFSEWNLDILNDSDDVSIESVKNMDSDLDKIIECFYVKDMEYDPVIYKQKVTELITICNKYLINSIDL